MPIRDKIVKLTEQLYPTGRAWKLPFNSFLKRLHSTIAIVEAQSYEDGLSLLYSLLPDNDNFDESDAATWERALGMVTNISVSLDDRKLAIIRKLNHPGTIPARQHWRYLERELQAAGFDVYVAENKLVLGGGPVTLNPLAVSGGVGSYPWQHGDAQHGDFQHGVTYEHLAVNSLDRKIDRYFNLGDNLRSTFFIGGNPTGTFAEVDAEREQEFRDLIIRIKPRQTVAFLFINYI